MPASADFSFKFSLCSFVIFFECLMCCFCYAALLLALTVALVTRALDIYLLTSISATSFTSFSIAF